MQEALKNVDVAYQNLESAELGVTTVDHYFDTLGGISRAIKRAKGSEAAIYISDQTTGVGKVRTLKDQVALGNPDTRFEPPNSTKRSLATATKACARLRRM